MSIEKTKMNSKKRDKFVRYSEGATMYHMGQSKFMQLAKDAKACYKVGQQEPYIKLMREKVEQC